METSVYLKVFLMAVLVIIVLIVEKGIKLYSPISLVSVVYFFEFGVATINMMSNPYINWGFNYFSLKAINNAMIFILLAYLFFVLGYYFSSYNKNIKDFIIRLVNKIPSINNYTIEIRNLGMVLLILLIIGWICRVINFKMGNYYHTEVGNASPADIPAIYRLLSPYIGLGTLFPMLALCLSFMEWLEKRTKHKYFLISLVLLVLEMVYALPAGSKERMALPILILIFIYSLKGRVPIIPAIVGVIFYMLFIAPFVGIYRNIYLTGDTMLDLTRTFNIYLDIFRHNKLQAVSTQLYSTTAERLNYSIVTAVIMENTPKVWDFKLGITYFLFILSLVPRIIWPGKPEISSYENDFGRDYGFLSPTDYTTSVDITWIGEMFINFGWYGILIGFLYGVFYRIIYTYFLKVGKLTPVAALLYSFALYFMMRGGMFAIQFSGLVKFYVGILLVLYPFLKKIRS